MKSEKPVFIIGNPRSGTTLLRLAVTSHSHICIPPEAGFLCWFAHKYGSWGFNEWNGKNIDIFLKDISDSKKFETWGLPITILADAFQVTIPESYSSACSIIYNEYRKINKPAAPIWGDKNNFYINHVNLIYDLYPNGRFIHLIRDPRDVACSYIDLGRLKSDSIYKPQLPDNPVEIANQWLKNNISASAALNRIHNRQRISIRYEDLTLEPISTLTTLCSFLELDFEDAMLDLHLHNKNNCLEPFATMDWKKRTLDPITSSQIGRYKSDLNNNQITDIERIVKDYMVNFGYFCDHLK